MTLSMPRILGPVNLLPTVDKKEQFRGSERGSPTMLGALCDNADMLPTSPVPTPYSVRILSSLLIGMGVAALSTSLPRGVQVIVLVLSIGAGCLLIFSHPYRRKIRATMESHHVAYRPTLSSMLPLFLVWLALMITPMVAPLPLLGSALLWAGISSWMYLVLPHIDGSRALAYLDENAPR